MIPSVKIPFLTVKSVKTSKVTKTLSREELKPAIVSVARGQIFDPLIKIPGGFVSCNIHCNVCNVSIQILANLRLLSINSGTTSAEAIVFPLGIKRRRGAETTEP